MKRPTITALRLTALLLWLGFFPAAWGQGSPGHQVIANGNALGTTFMIAPPVIQDDGSVLFADTFSSKIFRGDGVTTTLLVRDNTVAPGGGVLKFLDQIVAACSNGDFAIRGDFLQAGVYREALYAWRSGTFYRLAAGGDSAPGGGTFERFGLHSINRNGSVVFVAELLGGAGAGIYLARITGGNVTLQRITAAGEAAPGGGLFSDLSPSFGGGCAVDDTGRVVFAAERTEGSFSTRRYLFTWDGTSMAVVPNSQSVDGWMINNSGQVALESTYTLYFGPLNAPIAIVRRDDPAPGGGTFGIFDGIHLSENGNVAFYSSYLNRNGGSNSDGVFLWNSSRGVVLISHNDGSAPGGGVFSGYPYTGSPFVTNSGMVYWQAQITSASSERLYMGDGEVRELVAADGTSLGATQARSVSFPTTFPLLAGNGPADSSGRLTYVATTSELNDYVVRFTPPAGWGVPAEREIVIHQPDGSPLQNGHARSFGSVGTGTSGSLTFSIKNIGKTLLSGISASIEGTHPADFTVTTPPASSVAGPSGSTLFAVAFSPRALGSRSAVLRIASNDADENPYLIPLSGTGVSPEIVVEQPAGTNLVSGVASIAFPSTPAGTQSAARVFTIRNTGSVALIISEITNTSGQPGSFLIQTPGMLTSVPPGGSTTFSVTFAPTGAGGSRATTLRIANNDADESVFQIALTGTTIVPDLVMEQPAGSALNSGTSTINFGVQNGGTAGTPVTFLVRNTGAAPLSLLGLTANGAAAADFQINTTGMSPQVPAGGSTSFSVRFVPTADGPRTATLQVQTNDPDQGLFAIQLSGTGVAPEIDVQAQGGGMLTNGAAVNFGIVHAGTGTGPLTFTILNNGSAPLNLSNVTVLGLQPGDFMVNTSAMSATVAAGGNTSFTVNFVPVAAGTRAALLRISSNDGNDNPFEIQLSGTGTRPEIAVEHPLGVDVSRGGVVSLGSAAIGRTEISRQVVIRNVGETPLSIGTITVNNGQPSEFSVDAASMAALVPAGQTTAFSVRFAPTALGARSAPLTIANGDLDENPFNLQLQGTGILNTAPVVTLNGQSLLTLEAAASYTDAGATASDAEDGQLTPTLDSNTVVANREGTYEVTWAVTDQFGDRSSATRTVIVEDTTPPAIVPPADIVVVATSTGGRVVTYPSASASDVSGQPVIRYSTESGSLFPVGETVVTVTANDTAGNQSEATFLVKVLPFGLDRRAPVVRISTPSARTRTVAESFSLAGSVWDDAGLRSLVVKVNGLPVNLDVPVEVEPGVVTPWAVSSVVAENGPNTIEVEAVDHAGRIGRARHVVSFVRDRLELAGIYPALVTPSGTPGTGNFGFTQATVTRTGAVSGSLRTCGASFSFRAVLRNDGSARFLPALSDTLELKIGRGASASSLGELRFQVSAEQGLTGSVSSAAAFQCPKPAYHSTTLPLPATHWAVATHTLALVSKSQSPTRPAASYPQGDGPVLVRLAQSGLVTLSGSLADGSRLSTSAFLRSDDSLIFFTPLYANKGGFGGKLQFQPLADSDISGTNLLWLRPETLSAKQYQAGWPTGIHVDAAGTKYSHPASINFGQSVSNLTTGNAWLVFADGLLPSPTRYRVNLDRVTGQITRIPATNPPYTFQFFPSSGWIQGTFPLPDGSRPVFQGVILNKGQNRGGFGYFLGSGIGAQSGSMALD